MTEFVIRARDKTRTIAAVATARGQGGVAIIRISGKSAFEVADRVFSGPIFEYKSHTAHYGKILDKHGSTIDNVLVLVMKGPKSFTGEDTVEIQCHGGELIPQKILQRVFEEGAFPADPGEFSEKAFFNGKLDLAQAEGLAAKIGATSDASLKCAELQLEGALSKKISSFQKRISEIAAILEAWVDFPEEDLAFASFDSVIGDIELIISDMQRLVQTYERGKIMSDGVRLCLVGCPNVGKSSLMNALLQNERAIVSPIPGTTRDVIEDQFHLNGLKFCIIDTAGIRDTDETIEEEGIRRSKKAAELSDIILFVCDALAPHNEHYEALKKELPLEKTILIWNKCDEEHKKPLPNFGIAEALEISAKEGLGLNNLHDTLCEAVLGKKALVQDEITISQLRHKNLLSEAIKHLEMVINGLQNGLSCEFISSDCREALLCLGTIIGTNVTEDILNAIFSKFCIGK